MALIKCPDCGSEVSDAAPACPKCGRPIAPPHAKQAENERAKKIAADNRKTTTRAKIALGILAVIGLLAWLSNKKAESLGDAVSSETTSAQQASAPSQPDIETTPDQLQAAYDTNEVAADNIFKGHAIRIVGRVASIDKDFTDSVVIRFVTTNQLIGVSASLEDSEKSAAAKLRKGMKVSVDCQQIMRVVGSPTASKCVISPVI